MFFKVYHCTQACSANLYRCIKRRVGRSLRRAHYKGNLLPPRKQVALGLLWEDLDPHVFPPVAILGKVLEKFQDYLCKRIIPIAPGWATMPWFWDLVTMSGQIALYLPNLLTQPFSQIPHRILPNLNLNVWLLEPQLSMSEVSLRQWQHELKLLRESQPNQSMRLSGPFLQSRATEIRWTSGQRLLTSC